MKVSGFACALVGTLILGAACASGGDVTDSVLNATRGGNESNPALGGQSADSGGTTQYTTNAAEGGDDPGTGPAESGGRSSASSAATPTGGRRAGTGGSRSETGGRTQMVTDASGGVGEGGTSAARSTGGARTSFPTFGATGGGGGRSSSTAVSRAGSSSTSGGAGGGCDFKSTSCTDVCSTLQEWEVTKCTSLMKCLDGQQSCITKDDPLCATKDPYKNPICTDYYNFQTSASKPALEKYVLCVCGL
jgi:hypothetical protein